MKDGHCHRWVSVFNLGNRHREKLVLVPLPAGQAWHWSTWYNSINLQWNVNKKTKKGARGDSRCVFTVQLPVASCHCTVKLLHTHTTSSHSNARGWSTCFWFAHHAILVFWCTRHFEFGVDIVFRDDMASGVMYWIYLKLFY